MSKDMETKVDADAIREVMLELAHELADIGVLHKIGGWDRVLEEVQGGVIGAAIRNPVNPRSLKEIDLYLQELGAEAKRDLAANPADEAAQKAWKRISNAYEVFRAAVKSGMAPPPVVQLQTWLRQLNYYMLPMGQHPVTGQPLFRPGDVHGRFDNNTRLALELFRKKVGLPQNVPLNNLDLATLRKHVSG